MKKIYILFLLAIAPIFANAQTEINGLYYHLNSSAKTAAVTSHSYCHYSGRIVIPKSVSYNGVTYKVTSIESGAFMMDGVTSVSIGSNVVSIGSGAFQYCDEMTSLTIGSKVTTIGDDAFMSCFSLKSVTIPNSVTYVGSEAFCQCSNLTTVVIGTKVESIGIRAFCGCKNLNKVTIPNSVIDIGDGAFLNCTNLTSVTIGDSVTTIGNSAFELCSKLKSLTIGNRVTNIGGRAFHDCSGLKTVTIPNSVKTIGENAFGNCSGLTSVHISDVAAWCKIVFGEDYSNPLYYAHRLFLDDKELKDLVIPKGVKTICEMLFYGCTSLNSVSISKSVTSIGESAFENCSNLKSVIIGNGVKTIGKEAFESCTNLIDLTIGSGVNDIGEYAFWDLPKLTSITSRIINPSPVGDNVFWNKSVELTVPFGTIDNYRAVADWKNFKTIVEAISLNKTDVIIKKSKAVLLEATVHPSTLKDKSVTWKSSNSKVATVSSDGWVRGIKTGTATITCTCVATGAKTTCQVTVGKVTLNTYKTVLEKGKTLKLTANVYPSSLANKGVTWKSSNTKVATVSSTGKVKGIKAGTATITCTSVALGLKATCKVTVGYVKLDQTEVTVKKGKTVTLTPTVYPSSLEDKSVTWESSDTKIATVTSEGKVKGIKAGTATITCTSNATGLSTTCTVTVKATSSSRSLEGDDDDEVTGIETIDEASALAEPYDVYDLSGRKVLHQVTSLDGLPVGVYIINGKKILKK